KRIMPAPVPELGLARTHSLDCETRVVTRDGPLQGRARLRERAISSASAPAPAGALRRRRNSNARMSHRVVTGFQQYPSRAVAHPAGLGVGGPRRGDAYAGVSSTMRPSLQPYLASKSRFTVGAS